jgi:hypothetical protein
MKQVPYSDTTYIRRHRTKLSCPESLHPVTKDRLPSITFPPRLLFRLWGFLRCDIVQSSTRNTVPETQNGTIFRAKIRGSRCGPHSITPTPQACSFTRLVYPRNQRLIRETTHTETKFSLEKTTKARGVSGVVGSRCIALLFL